MTTCEASCKVFYEAVERLIEEQPLPEEPGVIVSIDQDGVPECRFPYPVDLGSYIRFIGDTKGYVLSLEKPEAGVKSVASGGTVSVVLLGNPGELVPGDPCWIQIHVLEVPVGRELCGRVVNALGQPIDGKGPIKTSKTRPIEPEKTHGVIDRENVDQPVMTGIKAIDGMIPIGRGQRELLIGDRQTGRTAVVLDSIINQKNTDMVCIYVSIGQREVQVRRLVKTLQDNGAMENTVVVCASASESAALQFIAPFSGCAMGEEIMESGGHALIVYDDLTKHAWAYRQLSLLLRRPPGREAYPGDVFYLHSRLLERAAKLNKELGGGSLTALPIIETQLSDVSSYIPTNVISITDGQIYLDTDLFNAGIRPAISPGISVSRVGGNAQFNALRKTAGKLRSVVARSAKLASVSQIDSSELDPATVRNIEQGRRIQEYFKQEQYEAYGLAEQVIGAYVITSELAESIHVTEVRTWMKALLSFVKNQNPGILQEIEETKEFGDDLRRQLDKALENFRHAHKVGE